MSLQFVELGYSETWTNRIAAIEFLYLFSGLLIGFLYYQKWLLAGVVGWGSILLGILALAEGESGIMEIAVIPVLTLGLTICGGYAGALLNTKVYKRLFRRT